MAKRKVPGDVRLDPLKDRAREQPLGLREKELTQRAYELYRFFVDQHAREHEEMRLAREMRRMLHREGRTSPSGSTLNSSIDNAIADQIDNMPEAMLVPERLETANSAEEMTDIVSFVLYQSGWPGQYQKIMEDAMVTGTGVAEVLWDPQALGGEGMVSVTAWHPEDIYPDPAYEDIQSGRAIFKTAHTTVAWVEEHYPHAAGYVQGDEYAHQGEQALIQAPQGDRKVTLIEYWYKRYDAQKRRYRVHMAQLAGGALLYSSELDFGTEREGEFAEGIYAHGQYPFLFYRYRNVPGRPLGTGIVHDYKDVQDTIDRYYKYIDDNARQSSIQRTFVRKGSGVNPDELADMSRTIIEWNGNDIREVMQTVQANPLNGQVFQMTQYLSDMMKQDSGQNQFSRGEGGLGVTAASAIEALQEAGGKITRWHTELFKDAFREMVEQILWVLSEYMEPGRKLLIVGGWDSTGSMKERIVELKAADAQGDKLPKPAYAVRVQVQRHNPLTQQRYNELLIKASEICAQSGEPMPPDVFLTLIQGYPDKQGILRAVRENSRRTAQMQQQAVMIEQLGAQLRQQQETNTQILRGMRSPGGAQMARAYTDMTQEPAAAGAEGGGKA